MTNEIAAAIFVGVLFTIGLTVIVAIIIAASCGHYNDHQGGGFY